MSYTVEQYTHRNDIAWANVLVDLVCGVISFRLLSIESKHVTRELLTSYKVVRRPRVKFSYKVKFPYTQWPCLGS